jgi:hypothetical protein
MPVVSVRLKEEDEAWIRKRKLSPGTFARDAVHEVIRLKEIEEAHEWLAKNRLRGTFDATAFIRKDRESH